MPSPTAGQSSSATRAAVPRHAEVAIMPTGSSTISGNSAATGSTVNLPQPIAGSTVNWTSTAGGWFRAQDPNNPQYQISYNPGTGHWDYSNPNQTNGVQYNGLGNPTSFNQAVSLYNNAFGAPPGTLIAASPGNPVVNNPQAPAAGASTGSTTDPFASLAGALSSLASAGAPSVGAAPTSDTSSQPQVVPTQTSSGVSPLAIVLFLVAGIAIWFWYKKHHGHGGGAE